MRANTTAAVHSPGRELYGSAGSTTVSSAQCDAALTAPRASARACSSSSSDLGEELSEVQSSADSDAVYTPLDNDGMRASLSPAPSATQSSTSSTPAHMCETAGVVARATHAVSTKDAATSPCVIIVARADQAILAGVGLAESQDGGKGYTMHTHMHSSQPQTTQAPSSSADKPACGAGLLGRKDSSSTNSDSEVHGGNGALGNGAKLVSAGRLDRQMELDSAGLQQRSKTLPTLQRHLSFAQLGRTSTPSIDLQSWVQITEQKTHRHAKFPTGQQKATFPQCLPRKPDQVGTPLLFSNPRVPPTAAHWPPRHVNVPDALSHTSRLSSGPDAALAVKSTAARILVCAKQQYTSGTGYSHVSPAPVSSDVLGATFCYSFADQA